LASKYALFCAIGAFASAAPDPQIRRPFFTTTTLYPALNSQHKYVNEDKQSTTLSDDLSQSSN